MLANNIWRFIESIFQFLFKPFEYLRLETNDSWWLSNIVNWVFIVIGIIGMVYWMSLMYGYKRKGKEDEA